MAEIFNAEKEAQNFIDNRERYFKSRINEHRFYSEKYQFLFGVEFIQENNHAPNCTYIKVENIEQSFELLKRLEVYELETAQEKLNVISKGYLRGSNFPCYLALCEKFIRFDT